MVSALPKTRAAARAPARWRSVPRPKSPPATISKRSQDGRTVLSSYEAGGGVAGAELSIRTLVLLLSVLNTW
jgi:hypothetical protein